MTEKKNMNAKELAEYVQKHGGGRDSHGSHGGHARQLHHMYVPLAQKGHMLEGGKKVPVHNLHLMTRADAMSNLVLNSTFRYGSLGAAYKSYFYAIVCFVLTVLAYNINLYLAAVFAYLTGMYWSQRLVAPPWNITWYKGKALYYTK